MLRSLFFYFLTVDTRITMVIKQAKKVTVSQLVTYKTLSVKMLLLQPCTLMEEEEETELHTIVSATPLQRRESN